MSTAIWDDLEIDKSDMLTDPETFIKRMEEKAEELKAVCRKTVTIQSLESRYADDKQEVQKSITDLLDVYYTEMDSLPLNQMADAIKKAKKLVADLETAYRDRLIREASHASGTMQDKKLAHIQYTRLRDAHESFIKALPILGRSDIVASKLPPLPGNYGGGNTTFVHYVFAYKGEEYRNHHAICRLLGIETRPLMDVLEWINANPNCGVTVTEVK